MHQIVRLLTFLILFSTIFTVDTFANQTDFNGDGKADLMWRNSNDGRNIIWLMNGGVRSEAILANSVTNFDWALAGTGDFDGDGKADILWRNSVDGRNLLWLMNGGVRVSQALLASASIDRTVAAVKDFNGDGTTDILWRTSDGKNIFWFMDGATRTGAILSNSVTNSEWSLGASDDFDGDGHNDLLWRNSVDGRNIVWLMDSGVRTSAILSNSVTNFDWTLAGTGDFDGNGKADILWRNKSDGRNLLWFMDGGTRTGQALLATATTDRQVAAVDDFDGDFKSDILWRTDDGRNIFWFMNGATRVGATLSNSVTNTDWGLAVGQKEDTSSIVGVWSTTATDNELLSFVFFADGTYVHLEVDEVAPIDVVGETSGMEWGTYSHNTETGELTVTQTFDANGDTGLTDATALGILVTANVSGDILTLGFDDNENGVIDAGESLSFDRTTAEEYFLEQEAVGFSSLTAGTYESQIDRDLSPTTFVLNGDNTGQWSYRTEDRIEGGSITWDVSNDGVLTITFEGGGFEEYTLTSGDTLSGTVKVYFSNESESNATWSKR